MSIKIGFSYGANHHTRNLPSVAWAVYFPNDDLVSLGGFFLGLATNNVLQYHVVACLLTESSSLGISHMVFLLDSQLVVSKINHIYTFYNHVLLRLYLRICFPERDFDYIHYKNIHRELNTVIYSLANYILNWHLEHI